MSTDTVENHSAGEKKGYNPDEIKTIVDVLDQRALMNIITSELPSYTGSKMLKLSKLGITKIEALSCLDHLNRLDLSYNKLKSVREGIAVGNLEELTYLNLNCNILSGKGIRGILTLGNLVFLNLGNNRISVIPDFAFAKMEKMQCLLLNNNRIENIAFVSILSELNTLVLSNNVIKSIPADAFKNLTKLRKLSLGHNQLTEFPSVFHIEWLKELNLNGNKITSIPDDITKLRHLTQLDIGNNLIENVQSLTIFQSMTSLTKLNVAQNTFYGVTSDDADFVSKVESVNKTVSTMLPQLTVLNNRQLALGKEKKDSRRKHFEEKTGLKSGSPKTVEKKEAKPKKVEKSSKKVVTKKIPAKASESPKKDETPQQPSEEKELAQSGVLEVETVNTHQTDKSHQEDVSNFLLGKDTAEELDGWD